MDVQAVFAGEYFTIALVLLGEAGYHYNVRREGGRIYALYL